MIFILVVLAVVAFGLATFSAKAEIFGQAISFRDMGFAFLAAALAISVYGGR